MTSRSSGLCRLLEIKWTLRNRFAVEYGGAPVLPAILQANAAEDIFRAAAARSDREYFPMPAGETTGLISDILSAADIVRTLVREAGTVLQSLEESRSDFRTP